MKTHLLFIIAVGMFLLAVVTSCNKEKDEAKVMTMTAKASGEIRILLAGIGTATIDWGNSSEKETKTLSDETNIEFSHNYSASNTRTIRIFGDNITGLYCSHNQLTSLDVSNNTKLTNLVCVENQLTNLDMSFNTVLTWLDCRANNLSTAALNALFRTLHNNDVVYIQTGKKNIHIGNNPGTSDCNQNIAEEKGWEVNKSSQL